MMYAPLDNSIRRSETLPSSSSGDDLEVVVDALPREDLCAVQTSGGSAPQFVLEALGEVRLGVVEGWDVHHRRDVERSTEHHSSGPRRPDDSRRRRFRTVYRYDDGFGCTHVRPSTIDHRISSPSHYCPMTAKRIHQPTRVPNRTLSVRVDCGNGPANIPFGRQRGHRCRIRTQTLATRSTLGEEPDRSEVKKVLSTSAQNRVSYAGDPRTTCSAVRL